MYNFGYSIERSEILQTEFMDEKEKIFMLLR
jgi:hypothetical protein